MKRMKAVVLETKENAACKVIERPRPKEMEVLVKVKAAGLCGSDFHIYHGTYPAKYPLIPGHEFSGVIEETGSGVTDWKPGQRVTVDPNIYCNSCYYCLRDQKNMCECAEALGVTMPGGFGEYVVVPVKQLYELPDSVSFEEGALAEPLACVVYGMKRLQPGFGGKAVIFGAGPMGLLFLKALRAGGVSSAAVVDVEPERRKAAENLGAAASYASIDELKRDYPRGLDIVVDATGNPQVIQQMFQTAARRAKILQFGCAPDTAFASISPYEIYNNDWEYIGTKTAVFTYEQALDLLAGKVVTGDGIVNDKIPLEKLPEYLRYGKPAASLKVIITIS